MDRRAYTAAFHRPPARISQRMPRRTVLQLRPHMGQRRRILGQILLPAQGRRQTRDSRDERRWRHKPYLDAHTQRQHTVFLLRRKERTGPPHTLLRPVLRQGVPVCKARMWQRGGRLLLLSAHHLCQVVQDCDGRRRPAVHPDTIPSAARHESRDIRRHIHRCRQGAAQRGVRHVGSHKSAGQHLRTGAFSRCYREREDRHPEARRRGDLL